MMVIKNNIVPLKGYSAMALWPFIFVRNDAHYNVITERHERIHFEQQKELLLVGFYLWYGIEWLVKLCYYRNSITAYKNISFEREAYNNANDIAYLDSRKHFSWIKYITNNN